MKFYSLLKNKKNYIFLIIVLFSILRFINLDADFPIGITSSGVVFTDEGFYSNSATRMYYSGNLILPGDFNPIVNMPLGQLIQYISFLIGGPSLISVRLTIAISSVISIITVYFISKKLTSKEAALFSTLILSTSFIYYSYSRIGIMEPLAIMLVLLSLYSLIIFDEKKNLSYALCIIISGVSAILIKMSMIFILPLICLYLFLSKGNFKERIGYCFVILLPMFLLILIYILIIKNNYIIDYKSFNDVNVKERGFSDLIDFLKSTASLMLTFIKINYITLLTIILILVIKRKFFEFDKPTILCLSYISLYIAIISTVNYHPPRYFLPLIPVLIIYLSHLIFKLNVNKNIVYIFLFVFLSINIFNIIKYNATLKYSYVNMVRDVGDIIQKSKEPKVLIGAMANTINLESNILSLNLGLTTLSPTDLVQRYKPYFLITNGNTEKSISVLQDIGADFIKIKEWKVFDNQYGNHENVILWRIDYKNKDSTLKSTQ